MRAFGGVIGCAALAFFAVFCLVTGLAVMGAAGLYDLAPGPLKPLVVAWIHGDVPPGSDPDAPDALGVYNRVPCEGHQVPWSFYCGRLVTDGVFYVTDCFGTLRKHGRHAGIDFGAYSGSTVLTPISGRVTYAGWNGPYGLLVVIENQGIQVFLAHNKALLVDVGDQVQAGEAVALSDNTGASTGPHIHLEVRQCGEGDVVTAVDPASFVYPGGETCNWLAVADYVGGEAPPHCHP